jgi:lipoyl(octanoyl) transferase
VRFRLLVDGPAGACYNMAVDEALYRSTLEAPALATLRLYRFHPSAVSFGYRQPFHEVVDPVSCRALGIEWVRRPTGGRALLHQHELTYCVTAPCSGALAGLSVRATYEVLTNAVRRSLEALGAPLDPPATRERSGVRAERDDGEPCLAVPGRHEISSRNRKLVASAQRRSPRSLLQHGSILRRVDERLWSQITGPAASTPLHAIGLDDLVPGIADEALVEALREAFEETFGEPASREPLSPREEALLPPLIEKYRSRAWTVEHHSSRRAARIG